jgi:hypothetical protein
MNRFWKILILLVLVLQLPGPRDVVAQTAETFTSFVTGAPADTALTSTDMVPCIQGGITKSCLLSRIASFVGLGSVVASGDCTGTQSGSSLPLTCAPLAHLASANTFSNLDTFSGVNVAWRKINSNTTLCASLGGACAPSGNWPGIDSVVCVDTTGGAVTATMPPGTGTTIGGGSAFTITIIDCRDQAATHAISISPNVGQTIRTSGSTLQITTAGGSINLAWDYQDNDWVPN